MGKLKAVLWILAIAALIAAVKYFNVQELFRNTLASIEGLGAWGPMASINEIDFSLRFTCCLRGNELDAQTRVACLANPQAIFHRENSKGRAGDDFCFTLFHIGPDGAGERDPASFHHDVDRRIDSVP